MLISSEHIKTAVLCWFRFARQYHYVATEIGYWSADVAGATPTMLVEVEVKVSKSDFMRDFQKSKHAHYLKKMSNDPTWKYTWAPNKFFFAVPDHLEEFALKHLEETKSPYGLIVVRHEQGGHYPVDKAAYVAKQAKYLHRDPPKKGMFDTFLSRMSSAICIDAINAEMLRNHKEELKSLNDKLAKLPDIDPEVPDGLV